MKEFFYLGHNVYRAFASALSHFLQKTNFVHSLGYPLVQSKTQTKIKKRIWFHAASAGELQGLWPVIVESLLKDVELVITIFSPSAERSLLKLVEEIEVQNRSTLIWVGYCPLEGEWLEALQKYKPDVWVTLKYEAWPDLWASLTRMKIPTVIVGARARSSLRWAARICKILTMGQLPQLILLTTLNSDVEGLKKIFKKSAVVEVTGDPRWDQMGRRSLRKSPRAEMLLKTFEKKQKPWGVVGSAWLSDLEFLTEKIFQLPGTLWLVPHEIEGPDFEKIEFFLRDKMISFEKTKSRFFSLASHPDKPTSKVILVNEMGILAELYAQADWAYVGGGFETGVHSTLEPGFFGLPIAIGPCRALTFPEITELQKTGQVSILNNSVESSSWLQQIRQNDFVNERKIWLDQVQTRMGATQRVIDSVLKLSL